VQCTILLSCHCAGGWLRADDELEQRLAALRRAKGATPDKEGAKAKKRAPSSSNGSSSSPVPKKGVQGPGFLCPWWQTGCATSSADTVMSVDTPSHAFELYALLRDPFACAAA
jgi:hypothetical protein